jgi:hypothetical protein
MRLPTSLGLRQLENIVRTGETFLRNTVPIILCGMKKLAKELAVCILMIPYPLNR